MCIRDRDAPFEEAYFLPDAVKFRENLKLPLVYVGGLVSREKIEELRLPFAQQAVVDVHAGQLFPDRAQQQRRPH